MNVNSSSGNRTRMFKVLCPIERKDGSTYWMRVGTGFPNKDQSINVYIDAMPCKENKLQLREMDDEDFARSRRRDDAGSHRPPPPPPAAAGPGDLPF